MFPTARIDRVQHGDQDGVTGGLPLTAVDGVTSCPRGGATPGPPAAAGGGSVRHPGSPRGPRRGPGTPPTPRGRRPSTGRGCAPIWAPPSDPTPLCRQGHGMLGGWPESLRHRPPLRLRSRDPHGRNGNERARAREAPAPPPRPSAPAARGAACAARRARTPRGLALRDLLLPRVADHRHPPECLHTHDDPVLSDHPALLGIAGSLAVKRTVLYCRKRT